MTYPSLSMSVWGPLACFTRPEMKVERVSYEVMTPSAARGILEAIFWKPEFRWRIREIHVLRPVRFFSLLRNEVNNRVSMVAAQRKLSTGNGYVVQEDRNQRHTLCLRDVAYTIVADMVLREDVQDDPAKYRDQFRRRVQKGQCYTMPYLGCREFSASFGPEPPMQEGVKIQPINADLGRMLLDLDYHTDGSGRGEPRFFPARLQNGVLFVPPSLYTERTH